MAWPSPSRHVLAEAFLKGLVAITTTELAALEETARRQAFWISGATELSLVQDALSQIGEGLVAGTPWNEFQESLLTRLETAWAGSVKNPPARLELITRNLGQRTYNAGRWIQMHVPGALESRPYGIFDAILDGRETEICASNNGLILALGHPAWQRRWPPLHHWCRSIVRSLSLTSAAGRGITGEGELAQLETPSPGFGRPPPWEWEPDPASYDPDLYQSWLGKEATM